MTTRIEHSVGVIGARSLVGKPLISALTQIGFRVCAFSRSAPLSAAGGQDRDPEAAVTWHRLGPSESVPANPLAWWVSTAPIWVLPNYFDWMLGCGVRRIVALSSTSRYTKGDSPDNDERNTATRLAQGEAELQAWAAQHGVQWVILRPTLIYGYGLDHNVSSIARFIQRWGFFALVGQAQGLRQPVHADDVATACAEALTRINVSEAAFDITGAEVLSYREMVIRVFQALGEPVRVVRLPAILVKALLPWVQTMPGFGHARPGMVDRMKQDMVFDHSPAFTAFGYEPRPFRPTAADVGGSPTERSNI